MVGAVGLCDFQFSLAACCRYDDGTEGFGNLDGRKTDATCCCVNEDVVAC
jgi:hypothetical protein